MGRKEGKKERREGGMKEGKKDREREEGGGNGYVPINIMHIIYISQKLYHQLQTQLILFLFYRRENKEL